MAILDPNDRDYLTAILQALPWLLGNVTGDVQAFADGRQPKRTQCGPNSVQRVLDDPGLGLAYGWLVGRKADRYVCVGRLLNTGVNRENVLRSGKFTEPTPMTDAFQCIGFVPDPQPFDVFNGRKDRLDQLPDDILHDLVDSLIRDQIDWS